jgi:hypothetical protein
MLNGLKVSSNINIMIKSRKIRLKEYLSRKFLTRKPEGKNNLKHLDVNRRIKLRWTLRQYYMRV